LGGGGYMKYCLLVIGDNDIKTARLFRFSGSVADLIRDIPTIMSRVRYEDEVSIFLIPTCREATDQIFKIRSSTLSPHRHLGEKYDFIDVTSSSWSKGRFLMRVEDEEIIESVDFDVYKSQMYEISINTEHADDNISVFYVVDLDTLYKFVILPEKTYLRKCEIEILEGIQTIRDAIQKLRECFGELQW
jgi:hypothetical protein